MLRVWCREGCLDQVEALLRAGVDVDEADVDLMTPLMMAAVNFDPTRPKIMASLLRAGANVNLLNLFEESVLDMVVYSPELISMLLPHATYATVHQAFVTACKYGLPTAIFLRPYVDLNYVHRGTTVFAELCHRVCTKRIFDILMWLHAEGADATKVAVLKRVSSFNMQNPYQRDLFLWLLTNGTLLNRRGNVSMTRLRNNTTTMMNTAFVLYEMRQRVEGLFWICRHLSKNKGMSILGIGIEAFAGIPTGSPYKQLRQLWKMLDMKD
jgi:hypothetical protein